MSEYQYYEFVAVDQPLLDEQVRALRALSTRARITSTRFVNHYNWGNFRGNPRALMEECFDLFVYVANWGTRCFMMRLPRRLFNPASTAPYFAARDVCLAWATKEHVILQFERSDIYEDDLAEYEFDDGSGWLAALAPLRQELLQGDQSYEHELSAHRIERPAHVTCSRCPSSRMIRRNQNGSSRTRKTPRSSYRLQMRLKT